MGAKKELPLLSLQQGLQCEFKEKKSHESSKKYT
jgi:hypothetical protein